MGNFKFTTQPSSTTVQSHVIYALQMHVLYPPAFVLVDGEGSIEVSPISCRPGARGQLLEQKFKAHR